jgi:hypothetical protein
VSDNPPAPPNDGGVLKDTLKAQPDKLRTAATSLTDADNLWFDVATTLNQSQLPADAWGFAAGFTEISDKYNAVWNRYFGITTSMCQELGNASADLSTAADNYHTTDTTQAGAVNSTATAT